MNQIKRKIYVVDRPMQLAMIRLIMGLAASILIVLFAIGFVLPSEEFFSGMTGNEVRNLALRLFSVSFFACTGCLAIVAVLISHRVAGPAMVLKRAVEGFTKGEFGHRTSLRDKDYLQDLATTVGAHGKDLARRSQQRAQLLRRLRGSVDAEAAELVDRLLTLEGDGIEAPTAAEEEPCPA